MSILDFLPNLVEMRSELHISNPTKSTIWRVGAMNATPYRRLAHSGDATHGSEANPEVRVGRTSGAYLRHHGLGASYTMQVRQGAIYMDERFCHCSPLSSSPLYSINHLQRPTSTSPTSPIYYARDRYPTEHGFIRQASSMRSPMGLDGNDCV